MSHEEIRSLLGAYAVGAVDESEAHPVQEHVAVCAECRAELDAMSASADDLAFAARPEALPEGFADRVVTAARAERPAAVAELHPHRRNTVLRTALASGIAALLAAVAVLSYTTVSANHRLAQQQAAIHELVGGGGGFHLTGTRGAEAKVVAAGRHSELVVEGLGPAPSGKTYQLWLTRNGKPVSGGTFDTSDDLAATPVPRSLHGFDGAAVTIEPAGGSTHPTSTPVLSS